MTRRKATTWAEFAALIPGGLESCPRCSCGKGRLFLRVKGSVFCSYTAEQYEAINGGLGEAVDFFNRNLASFGTVRPGESRLELRHE